MNYELSLALRRSATKRAHLYGAESLYRREAGDAEGAGEARRRYFRELEAVDLMGGHASSFGGLGA